MIISSLSNITRKIGNFNSNFVAFLVTFFGVGQRSNFFFNMNEFLKVFLKLLIKCWDNLNIIDK